MKKSLEKVVSFTGHRPKSFGTYGENPMVEWIQKSIYKVLKAMIKSGCNKFISGGALGVDQWMASSVLKLKEENQIKLVVARPFPSMHIKWPRKAIENFENILSGADEIVDVSEDPYSPSKMQKRNIWMVDNSDIVVAVYKGISGGTKNCIDYAISQNKDILHIHPIERSIKKYNESHINNGHPFRT